MESKLARDPATCPTRYHAQYNCPPRREPPKEGVGVIEPVRTGVGRFNAAMHRWGLRPSAACQCGAPEQTAQHILSECPDLRPPDNVDLTHPTPGTITWLEHLRDVT